MDLTSLDLKTDLNELVGRLDQEPEGPSFTLPANRFHKAKAEIKASRRAIKSMIKPENTRGVLLHLPAPGERTHCILRGDFVLCDLIPAILRARGAAKHVSVATLGLSTSNANTLAELVVSGQIEKLSLVCSHYFQQVNKITTFREVAARLHGIADLVITRAHAKVICLPMVSGDHFVIEGSANLRSSDNLEQMVIFNDAETLAFHQSWMEDLKHA